MSEINLKNAFSELCKIVLAATKGKSKMNKKANELIEFIHPFIMSNGKKCDKESYRTVASSEMPPDPIKNDEFVIKHPKFKKVNDTGFRFRRRNVFLTYSNDTKNHTVNDVFEKLKSLEKDDRKKMGPICHNMKEIFIVLEYHKSGIQHFHVFIEFHETIETKNYKLFDLEGLNHPNWRIPFNKRKVLSYMVKKIKSIEDWNNKTLEYGIDVNYYLKTKDLHLGQIGYSLINKTMSVTKAIEECPKLLFNAINIENNYNWYHNKKMEESIPEKKLEKWNMFGLNFEFDGKHKTPQFWICGPSNVGKTYNIKKLEENGHRAYLCAKDNNWSDYNDNNYDFMYFEEYQGELMIRDINQLLEGTKIRLNAKYTKSIIKNKNMPIIINSNYLPHEAYNKVDKEKLGLLLNRIYVIYVDKTGKGHIIWNPKTNKLDEYDNSLICLNDKMMEVYLKKQRDDCFSSATRPSAKATHSPDSKQSSLIEENIFPLEKDIITNNENMLVHKTKINRKFRYKNSNEVSITLCVKYIKYDKINKNIKYIYEDYIKNILIDKEISFYAFKADLKKHNINISDYILYMWNMYKIDLNNFN